MGILNRFRDIMSANINAILDKCENPEKMIDEYMRQVVEQLAEVKKETAGVMAEEKRTKRLVDENAEQIEKYDQFARKALTAGNEEDAKTFLTKKQEYVNNGVDLQKSYEVAKANATKMREMHDKLTKDVQELEQRRKNVKSKVAVARTQEKLNKVSSSMGTASDAMNAFERMEEKADNMLDIANSTAELNSDVNAEIESLEDKYSNTSIAVEDELEKLKKEMGL
ncbi:MAG: PspA/IM30 family protein [Clostridia bacterium]|nr:PspA/IM30 family protein [Clostridia bacterium]